MLEAYAVHSVIIYGLFDTAGKCHYVGQTFNPSQRERIHLTNPRSKFYGMPLMLRVILVCDARQANRLERQIGKALKLKGMAARSERFNGDKAKPCQVCNLIYVKGYALPFPNKSQAARLIGCAPQTVLRNIGGKVVGRNGQVYHLSHKPFNDHASPAAILSANS
jgi:hypothetical protein